MSLPTAAPAAPVATPTGELPPEVPDVGPLRPIKLPTVLDRTLSTGLRVIAARRPGIPRFEARLHIPLARGGATIDAARRRMLTATLLSGTADRTAVDIAESVQSLGGSIDTFADSDDVVVFGSALNNELGAFLGLLSEVISGPIFPDDEVALERDRTVQETRLILAQPAAIAQQAFVRRMYGRHPYGTAFPEAEAVERVRAPGLRKIHAASVLPKGSILVVVGDLRPERAGQLAEETFGYWKGRGPKVGLDAPPPIKLGPLTIINREGGVQTSIRLGRTAVRRSDPGFAGQFLANLVFGGYFSSRLSKNIREDKGYTYGAGSGVGINRSSAHLTISTDVDAASTVPALVEISYELGRMMSAPPKADELKEAKRFFAGNIAMGINTQAGLASYLAMLASNGLPLEYLRDFPKQVEALTAEEVHEAAKQHLCPGDFVTVLVGDAADLAPKLEPLTGDPPIVV